MSEGSSEARAESGTQAGRTRGADARAGAGARSLFVRDNFAAAKAAAPGAAHAVVMRALAERWRLHKAGVEGAAA